MGRTANEEWQQMATGCLLAGAAGDMIGGPFDRRSLDQMRREAGYVRELTTKSRIGDDTQLSLFTLEGLLRAHMRGLNKGICHPPTVVWFAYLRWGITQGIEPPGDVEDLVRSGWLLEQESLHDRWRPSPRCIEVVSRGEQGSVDRRPNRSDGSGAIMRIAPVGLLVREDAIPTMAADVAALTHGGDKAIAAAAAYASIVHQLIAGADLQTAATRAATECRGLPGGHVLAPALEKAFNEVQKAPAAPEAMHRLGTGRTSLGALLHAVYATASSESVEDAIAVAVNHDGTSATSGALAGQLAALVHGPDAIPASWTEAVPVSGLISEMIADWTVIESSSSFGYSGDHASDLWDKYPGY